MTVSTPSDAALRIFGLQHASGRSREVQRRIDAHKLNSQVAEMILAARERAGLTQAELAERIGTTQSAISRLEDADYAGHSLSMLQKVAAALGQRVELKLVKAKAAPRPRRLAASSKKRSSSKSPG